MRPLVIAGPNSSFFDPSRLSMKKVALSCGLLTPAWAFVFNMRDLEGPGVKALNFPLIVKHFNSYASIGMTKKSRVEVSE